MKLRSIAAVAIAAGLLSGCAIVQSPTIGLLYTKVQAPIAPGKGNRATKTGEACAQNFLGLAAFGDASIDAAKKAGGITEIASVDHDSTIMLMLYGQYCTIVKGE